MSDDNERSDSCSMNETDTQDCGNLCCCYAMDEGGHYEDPCFTPVEDYCCC